MIDPAITPLLCVGGILIMFTGIMVNECLCSTWARNVIRENPADFLWYPNKDY